MRWRDFYGDGSLWVVDVALACCALEVDASAYAAPRPAVAEPELRPGSRVAVVVSGTVTDRLVNPVLALLDAVAERSGARPTVISFGACASSGGPYWDSYAVAKGIDQFVPVDVYVPGCPPEPAALAETLGALTGRVSV